MTTIAYAAGVLVTDSASTTGATYTGSVRKLARGPHGSLVAACGNTLACAALLRWVDAGMPDDEMPKIDDGDFSALLVKSDGTAHLLGADGTQAQISAPFIALGSGREIAMGAMGGDLGPERAVRIACEYDGHSRLPLQILRLGE